MQSVFQYRHLKRHVRENLALGQSKAHMQLVTTTSDSSYQDIETGGKQPQYQNGNLNGPVDSSEKDVESGGEQPQDQDGGLNKPVVSSQKDVEAGGEQRQDQNKTPFNEPLELRTSVRLPSEGQKPLASILGVHIREKTKAEGGDDVEKIFLVYYMGEDDVTDAHSWSYRKRISATTIISVIGAVVGFASAIDSAALQQSMTEFGVDEVVGSLTTATFLLGFGTGALFSGPLSESIGRNPVYILTLVAYMIWIMASGLAPNMWSLAIFRFLAGFFGATPLVCAGGSLADIWSTRERVASFPVFAIASFMGPALGPVMGGFIGESPHISWRWVSWITLVISGLVLAAVVFLLPETYNPVMLKWKAYHLRTLTGDQRYLSQIEIDNHTLSRMVVKLLGRPFLLTFTELIILLVAAYLTVIYVIFFTFLNGYTFIFTETYGFSQGLTGLSFMGIAVGITIAGAFVPLVYRMFCGDLRRAEEAGFTSTSPESHLYFAMISAPAIPISLFWMGWTANPAISPWSPLVASVFFGYGIIGVFISCYQYIIASYDIYAASSLASVTCIRYVVAGGLVELAVPWYTALGVGWTLTILGVVSALLVPVPYVFYWYGYIVRKKSQYAFA